MADSYCAEIDVIARAQMGAYSGSTVPTTTQVAEFMDTRAAQLYGVMAAVVGEDAPGPVSGTNYTTELDVSTDKGFALSKLLLAANATGAAADALEASNVSQAPARSERVAELLAMYEGYFASIRESVNNYVADAGGYAATHISSGEITERAVTAREADAFTFEPDTGW